MLIPHTGQEQPLSILRRSLEMTARRWSSLSCFVVGALLAAQPAWAQLSLPPAGPSGGGFAGANSGGYGASGPLEFPAAHGGLPEPMQITHTEHCVGAAGNPSRSEEH